MINIVLPIVSNKLLDENEKFQYPLPLVEINGKSLIEYSLDSLNSLGEKVKFIFVLNEDDCNKYHFDNTLKLLKPQSEIVKVKGPTSGAVCSVLMAIDLLDKKEELLIVNYDQYLDFDILKIIKDFRINNCDGGIITFNSVHPRWSYARIVQDNVLETAEKNPISNFAIAGFYYFKNAEIFIQAAFNVIKYDDNYNGKYYTSSVYNQMILKNFVVKNSLINKESYHSFYSSQKVKEFENYLLKRNGKI
jgi:NDP-sugar pyrophosphorylase family protein